MQYSRLLLCLAAFVGSVVALPVEIEPEYTGAGGVAILNGVELESKRQIEPEYTGAGGVAILNGVELESKRQIEPEYTGAGGVAILNGIELPASE